MQQGEDIRIIMLQYIICTNLIRANIHITVSAAGLISGTPTTVGTSSFVVKATNSLGIYIEKDWSVIDEANRKVIDCIFRENFVKNIAEK